MICGTLFNCVLKIVFLFTVLGEETSKHQGSVGSGGSCGLPSPCDLGPGEAGQQLWALGISFQHFVPSLVQ